MTQGELLPAPEGWAAAAVETIYKAYPRKKQHATALASIQMALDRIVAGEIDGKPRTKEEAIFYLRDAATEARSMMFNRESRHIPYPSTWFNQSRYLRNALTEVPKDLTDCVEILNAYPNGIKVVPSNLDTYMPLLRVISECIECLHSTHGEAAASYIRIRVIRFAECVARWPEADLQYVPGPMKFFKERRYDNDPRTWECQPQNGYRSERDQLHRVVGSR